MEQHRCMFFPDGSDTPTNCLTVLGGSRGAAERFLEDVNPRSDGTVIVGLEDELTDSLIPASIRVYRVTVTITHELSS